MRKLLHALPLALALSVAPSDAFAGKAADAGDEDALPTIEETGITAFDSVFMKVKAIHDTVGGIEGRIVAVQDKIAAAVGLPAGTQLRMSMWELKQKAGGPVEVEMRGNKPYLTLGGVGSNEGKAAIEQINGAVPELLGVVTDLQKLPPQVMELVNACKGFPAQLNPQLIEEAGMSPLQLPKVAKTLGKNVKATIATPGRIESLVKTTEAMLTGIPQGIAATEPPTDEYIAEKKDEKKEKKESGGAGSLDAIAGTVVGSAIGSAWLAFNDAEVDQAVAMLGQADADLSRATVVVSRAELGALYQTQALVFMVDGNPAAASAATARALMVDPGASPIKDLGPEYAKLHKLMGKSSLLRTVTVEVKGDGKAWISGQEVAPNSSITLPQGEHLVQVEKNGQLTSQRLFIEDGFVLAI